MMKFIIYAYRVLSVIAIIYGLPLFIASVIKDDSSYAAAVISIFFGGFFLLGFSYIVEAASLFIKKHNKDLGV